MKKHLKKLSSLHQCEGAAQAEFQNFAGLPNGKPDQTYYRHIQYGGHEISDGTTCIQHTSTVRSTSCLLLLEPSVSVSQCDNCNYTQSLLKKKIERAEASKSKKLSKHNPLHSASKDHLIKELKQVRRENNNLETEVEHFKTSLKTEGVEVTSDMHASMLKIMQDNEPDDSLQKLFWEEQVKAFQSGPKGMRWHPMMLRLAILLHSRSPAAYDTLRNTGVLRLPGESTLKDYSNVYHPEPGFQKSALDELSKKAKHLKDNERFVVLLHDEMMIKSDLVFDKRSGNLVGFVQDGCTQTGLATHALVFYVVGVNTNISVSVGFFGTLTVTADVLYPLFWKAVGLV